MQTPLTNSEIDRLLDHPARVLNNQDNLNRLRVYMKKVLWSLPSVTDKSIIHRVQRMLALLKNNEGRGIERKPSFDLCPQCSDRFDAQGRLANKAENCTNDNPCSNCGSQAAKCTEYIDAVEHADFEKNFDKKGEKFC